MAQRRTPTRQRPRKAFGPVITIDPLEGVHPGIAATVRRKLNGRWKAVDLRVVTATCVEWVDRPHS